jgi:hypothetical protein
MTRKRFLYLMQGRKENVLKYSYLQNANSDLITLTFDFNILEKEFKSLLNIFLPNSSWAEGRNKQLEAAKKLETEYLYYIFVDDDVEFVKGNFYDFEQKLIKYSPAIGLPLLKIIKNTNRFNPKLNVQHPVAVDQQVQAYHHKVLKKSLVMPLETKFDNLSWWYSCEINGFLILSYYRGYIMQFNDIIVDNVGHHWDDETNKSNDINSNYLGGITSSGLELVREYIEDKYGLQPKLRNTLFHDNNFKKHCYLPRGKYLLKFYILNILEVNFKKCFTMFILQLKNNFNKYPKDLILNEREIQRFEDKISNSYL